MAALTRLSRPVSWYQRFTLWVVGAVLLLQVLALLSTQPCSGQVHGTSRNRPPFTSLLSRLSGHAMCEGQAEKAASSFEDMFQHRNSVRRQRPYAYAFCLTSVHHLCTALVNTVRLRKLRSFQVIRTHFDESGCNLLLLVDICPFKEDPQCLLPLLQLSCAWFAHNNQC